MNSTLILPCAGKSTRFNEDRPKWMLTHPNGHLMLVAALDGLDIINVDKIIITVVQEHIYKSKLNINKLKNDIQQVTNVSNIEFLILDHFTSSQSETVYKTIKLKNINGSIFIKDCDNHFNARINNHNAVCISSLDKNTNAINKSYVTLDKFGNLSGIIEKSVMGNKFCVGGYSFDSADKFCSTYEEVQKISNGEIYISHIIQHMLLNNELFETIDVTNYSDWGTIEDWLKYTKEFKTLFIDLDGVLVINGSEYFEPEWGKSIGIQDNIDLVNQMYDTNKVHIIITTSRKSTYEDQTYKQLADIGIKYHRVIFDLPHAERILVNDYSTTNPFPTARSICIKRNENNLKDYLK